MYRSHRCGRTILLVVLAGLPLCPGCRCTPADPGKDDANFREGQRLFLAGQSRAATSCFEAFLAAHPSSAHASDAHYFLGAAALKQGEAHAAEPHFRAALRAPRNDDLEANATLGLARCQFLRGDYRQCRATCLDLLKQHPASARADEALLLVAEASERAGLAAEARRYYRQVAERFPSSPLAARARTRLGSVPALPKPSPGGRYSVQVAALASAAKANEMAARLRRQGFPVAVVPIQVAGKTLSAIRVGPFATKAAAKTTADRLRKADYSAIIKD